MQARPSKLLRAIYPGGVWRMPVGKNRIYLTFDDGPQAEVTSFVLDELRRVNAKATFFCIGKNVKANPEILKQILEEGHTIGNHTFSHVNGWKTKKSDYLSEIDACAQWVNTTLFRPPYGRISWSQLLTVKKKYSVVLWDVLPKDYDAKLSSKQVTERTLKSMRDGSIIVFHDSQKAYPHLKRVLRQIIDEAISRGFELHALPQNINH